MFRARLIATLLFLAGSASVVALQLLGSELYLTKFSGLAHITFAMGLALAVLKELGYQSSQWPLRLQRIRSSMYVWQILGALTGLIGAVEVPISLLQHNTTFPLFPGGDEALYHIYLSLALDFTVLQPAELWLCHTPNREHSSPPTGSP
jgi:hypothetical protein